MLRERLMVACDQVTPEQNIALVQAISSEIPHSIVALRSQHELPNYTCLMHALGFTDQPKYIAIATLPGHDVYAGKEFAEWLLATESLTELATADAPVGSIVMYFDEQGGFMHAGLLAQHHRVQSKWGTLGLYEHDTLEVPSNYGDTVRYFEHLSFEDAIELFFDFAEEKGVQFQDAPDS